MSDSEETAESDAARMVLEPKAVHEGKEEPYLDCPQCGSQVTLTQIIEEGRCSGYLNEEGVEVEGEDQPLQAEGCTAELTLELVWEG